MDNRIIAREVEAYREIRGAWMERLSNSDSVVAAQHVLSINTKIEFLLAKWSWADESVEYPDIVK